MYFYKMRVKSVSVISQRWVLVTGIVELPTANPDDATILKARIKDDVLD